MGIVSYRRTFYVLRSTFYLRKFLWRKFYLIVRFVNVDDVDKFKFKSAFDEWGLFDLRQVDAGRFASSFQFNCDQFFNSWRILHTQLPNLLAWSLCLLASCDLFDHPSSTGKLELSSEVNRCTSHHLEFYQVPTSTIHKILVSATGHYSSNTSIGENLCESLIYLVNPWHWDQNMCFWMVCILYHEIIVCLLATMTSPSWFKMTNSASISWHARS